MNTLFPMQTVKRHSNDKSWMSVSIKQSSENIDLLNSSENIDLWRQYKSKVLTLL